jgi:serine protease inhibitor
MMSFYRKLVNTLDLSGRNPVYSPFSLYGLFNVLKHGAAGKTNVQLTKILGLSDVSPKKLTTYFSTTNSELNMTYALLSDPKCKVDSGYRSLIRRNYGAECKEVDFKDQKAIDNVNEWIYDQTNRKLKGSLEPMDIQFAAINVLAFSANWAIFFDIKEERQVEFLNEDGTKTKTAFMGLSSDLMAFENDKFSSVTLDYKGQNYSMIFILPKKENTKIDSLYESIIESIEKSEKKSEFLLRVPKFEVKYKDKDIRKLAEKIGLEMLFNPKEDFSAISDSFSLSELMQESYVKIDEVGTEAYSYSTLHTKGISDNNLILNTPFYYSIVDKKTKKIVFVGRINHF